MNKTCNKEEMILCTEQDFSKIYFEVLYNAETSYYFHLNQSRFNYLLYVYDTGIKFYSKKNEKYAKFLTNKLNSIKKLNTEINKRLKSLYLKTKIKNKLAELETSNKKASLDIKLKEESLKKIKKFNKDINSDIIIYKLELRNQRKNFIKNARNKLFNKFIKNDLIANKENIDITNQNNISITPIKGFDNDIFKHQIMIRTKEASNNKNIILPTEIFFDEDKYYLIKNNIGIFQIKEKKSQIEDLTKIFIEKYSLSYSQIIQEFIKKIIVLFDENYRNKIQKYKEYREIMNLYEMIIDDKYYKEHLIEREIALCEETLKYWKNIDELKIDLNDKLVESVDRFKIDNPIDNISVNEIVNDYVYEILGIFA